MVAQPPICGSTPAMTPFCANACIICDINGFRGINNSTVTGQAPPGFCTSFVHHMQWIGFIAGSTNLRLEVFVFNCRSNNGLEIGLYEGIDCQNFRRVSECDTDVRPNQRRVFENTVPLTIGQYYYLVMDGSANDVCNYDITVLQGSTQVAPLTSAAVIDIPDEICAVNNFELKTSGIPGATIYEWSIDGAFFNQGTKVLHTFEKPGTYNICLKASNVCNSAPESCKMILVKPTIRTTLKYEICNEDCYFYNGQSYCETGVYEVTFPASNGCDSIVELDIIKKEEIFGQFQTYICEGDTLFLGTGKFFTQGNHMAFIQNEDGCKINLSLNLKLIPCTILSTQEVVNVNCYAEKNGQVKFRITQGEPPFKYTVRKLENASFEKNGTIDSGGLIIEINNLDEGNYQVFVEDLYGNYAVFQAFVSQPSELKLSTTSTILEGYNISCFEGSDGQVILNAEGGISPYLYFLNDVSGTAKRNNLTAGVYTSKVVDDHGCVRTRDIVLTQPEKIKADISYEHPDCSGPETGSILLSEISGGVQPFRLFLNENNSQNSLNFSNLSEGSYQVKIVDKNGCETIENVNLKALKIANVEVSSEYNIELGDSVLLDLKTDSDIAGISWFPIEGLSCIDCVTPTSSIRNDIIYSVKVLSSDGCITERKIMINVIKDRTFVISNIHNRNSEVNNKNIRYLTTKGAESILLFEIYDRWGNMIFKDQNLAAGLHDVPFEYNFHGNYLSTGVYVYKAIVHYLDDINISYSGTLTVLD